MLGIHTLRPALVALLLAPAGAVAQVTASSGPDSTAAVEARASRGDLAGALGAYRGMLAGGRGSFQAFCNAARLAVDVGEAETDDARRTALYAEALGYARRAVVLQPESAEGHFHVARSLGRTALAAAPRERVRLSVEVRQAALTATRLDPRHAGAQHILGAWNAEVMRLSVVTRGLARAFLGGESLGEASWAEAVRRLEAAVSLEPERIVHRLDLALVYRDVRRVDDARRLLERIVATTVTDPSESRYQRDATAALRTLR